jgi:hypothetical protein
MGIQNFPPQLQAIIQQGFLEREFEHALTSKLGYRAVADREKFSVGIGETLTKTRAGLKSAVTTPMAPNSNTNFDNGLTPTDFSVEQYTITINNYAATTDLNMVTSRVGIADQFLLNAAINGEQAARSLDELARNALFNAYFGGNTWVRVGLTTAETTLSVDDIRGFQTAFVNGVQVPVSSANPLSVSVGGTAYTLVGATPDGSNQTNTWGGISGVLTFSSAVATPNGAQYSTITATTASTIVRPNARLNTNQIVSGDVLDMATLLNAVAALRSNAVPEIDGAYNCYLDPVSARQLFADEAFRQLFTGATSANPVFKRGMVNDFLGLRFISTTDAIVGTCESSSLTIRRPIVCGKGALIEADYAGMAAEDVRPSDAIVTMIDDVCMVTREPIDRLQQIIAQSWYWMGGFCAPSDTTTTTAQVATSNNSTYKRAVLIEHQG